MQNERGVRSAANNGQKFREMGSSGTRSSIWIRMDRVIRAMNELMTVLQALVCVWISFKASIYLPVPVPAGA